MKFTATLSIHPGYTELFLGKVNVMFIKVFSVTFYKIKGYWAETDLRGASRGIAPLLKYLETLSIYIDVYILEVEKFASIVAMPSF